MSIRRTARNGENMPHYKPMNPFALCMQSTHSTYTSFSVICSDTKKCVVGKPIIFTIFSFSLPSDRPGIKREVIWLFSFQLNAFLFRAIFDLAVYMRNDKPMPYTNLSLSCCPTRVTVAYVQTKPTNETKTIYT